MARNGQLVTVKLVITLEGDDIEELKLALSSLSIAEVQPAEATPVAKPPVEPQDETGEKPPWVQAAEEVMEEGPPKKADGPKVTAARTCKQCGTTRTPQWRHMRSKIGPLCNQCSMRLKRASKPAASPKAKPEPKSEPRIPPQDIGGMVHAALSVAIKGGEFVTAKEVATGLAIKNEEDQKIADQMAVVMMRLLEEQHVLYYKMMPENDTYRLLVLGYDAPISSLEELMAASGA